MFSSTVLGIHVVSLVAMALTFLLTFRKVKANILYRFSVAGAVTMLGLWFYDLVWLLGIYNGIDWSRVWLSLFFLAMLLVFNFVYKLHFLKLRFSFAVLFVSFICIMYAMAVTGWFIRFNAWTVDSALPDPCDWLWALSKVVGMFMWLPLIGRREKK